MSNIIVDNFRLYYVGGKKKFNHLMTKIKTCICIRNNLSNVVLMILSNIFNSITPCFFFVVLLLLIVNLKLFSLFWNSSKPQLKDKRDGIFLCYIVHHMFIE
jgi:hypothetical protein